MCVCARIYARWCYFRCYGSYWYHASLQVEVLFILACYSLPLRPILEWNDILGLIICQRIEKLLNVFYDLSRNHTPFYPQIMGICSSWCGYDVNKTTLLSHRILSSHCCIHVFILSPILLYCRFDLTWLFCLNSVEREQKEFNDIIAIFKVKLRLFWKSCFLYIQIIGRQVDNCFCNDFLLLSEMKKRDNVN